MSIRSLVLVLVGMVAANSVFGQVGTAMINSEKGPESPELKFIEAPIEKTVLSELDPARKVSQLDATPSGSMWLAVDQFANWSTIILNGHQVEKLYHDIPSNTAQITPNGDHFIWAGEIHAPTEKGFDSTVVDVYSDSTLLGSFVSDYPDLTFSRTGKHWAMLLPYAYEGQSDPHDFVIVDGRVVSQGEPAPHRFSFSHDETTWAYRATNGDEERLITSTGATTLYRRNPTWDATIWRFTPDIRFRNESLLGRDYDFDFVHVAKINRTAYSQRAQDTARTYFLYNGKNYGLYRWISEVQIDSSGKHFAFLACDTSVHAHEPSLQIDDPPVPNDERRGIVVLDGKIVAGPFAGVSRLFMSPSGEHIAYSTDVATGEFFQDRKLLGKTGRILSCIWSPNEKHIAFSAVGSHDKTYVVAGGKRSPLFERIGRIGWIPDGNSIEFVGLANAKLYHVKMKI